MRSVWATASHRRRGTRRKAGIGTAAPRGEAIAPSGPSSRLRCLNAGEENQKEENGRGEEEGGGAYVGGIESGHAGFRQNIEAATRDVTGRRRGVKIVDQIGRARLMRQLFAIALARKTPVKIGGN